MPPPRKRQEQKTKPGDLTLPGHNFLGPGTDRARHLPGTSRLDEIAKEHDLDSENENITTEEADKFIKAESKQGVLGGKKQQQQYTQNECLASTIISDNKNEEKTDNNPPSNNNLTTTRHRSSSQ